MSRAIYSKYFAFDFLKAKLSTIDILFGWNVINGISIIVSSIPVIVGSGLIVYNDIEKA